MKLKKEKNFVIALGGSVICPKEIDVGFLRRFHQFLKKEIKKGHKFVIVPGGGIVARKYQIAGSKITKILNEDKDWLGIHATRINAHLLRTIFRKEANPVVFDGRFKVKKFGEYSIIIASGWKPGWSTDYVALRIAADFKVKQVVILGKPDFVYTSDFEKNHNSKPVEKMEWKDYLKIIPSQWTPGLHAPVDPVAARFAKKENIKIIVANGRDLNNFKKILRGEKFSGTTLTNSKQ